MDYDDASELEFALLPEHVRIKVDQILSRIVDDPFRGVSYSSLRIKALAHIREFAPFEDDWDVATAMALLFGCNSYMKLIELQKLHPVEVNAKLRQLAGPHGRTIYKAMEAVHGL